MEKKAQYTLPSRGHKTKGYNYKERYIERPCPECEGEKVYREIWTTRTKYTCLKRKCRHYWYEVNPNPRQSPDMFENGIEPETQE